VRDEYYIGCGPGRIVYRPRIDEPGDLVSADPVIEIIPQLFALEAEGDVIRFPFQGRTLVYVRAAEQPDSGMVRLQWPD